MGNGPLSINCCIKLTWWILADITNIFRMGVFCTNIDTVTMLPGVTLFTLNNSTRKDYITLILLL